MSAWARYSCVPRALHTLTTFSSQTGISLVSAFGNSLALMREHRIGKCRGETERAGLAPVSQPARLCRAGDELAS